MNMQHRKDTEIIVSPLNLSHARQMLMLLDPAGVSGLQGVQGAPDPLTSDLLHLLVGKTLTETGDPRMINVTDDEVGRSLRQLRGATGWSARDYTGQWETIMAAGEFWLREGRILPDYPRRDVNRSETRETRFMDVTGRILISTDPPAACEWSLLAGRWTRGVPAAVGEICLHLAGLLWTGEVDGYPHAWTKALGKVLLAQVLQMDQRHLTLSVQTLITQARLPVHLPNAQQHFESGLAALQQCGLHLGCGYVNAQQHRPWLERDVQFVIPSVLTNW